MPLMVTNESTYELAPAGLHPAVCVDVVDEGFKPTKFGDKHKVRFVFQIEEKTTKGHRFTVSAWFNLSMHENSSMRQFLEKWRGQPFTEAQINRPPGFDLESVIGVPCTINIVHNSAGGKTYANVDSIAPHSNRMGQALTPEGYTRVEERETAQAAAAGSSPQTAAVMAADDSEIPF